MVIAGGVEHMGRHPMGEAVDPNPRIISEKIVDPDELPAPVLLDTLNAWARLPQRRLLMVAVRYDAVAWDPNRPAEEQAALHGRPLGFELKPKAGGNAQEVRDDRAAIGGT